MPYLRTSKLLPWESICKKFNFKYISPHPTEGIFDKLKEISKVKYMITEAMHGAILSDILRIPWEKFQFTADVIEKGSVNELKWQDWTRSLDINYKTYNSVSIPYRYTLDLKLLKLYVLAHKSGLISDVENCLNKLETEEFSLSSHENYSSSIGKIESKLDSLKNEIYK